MATNGILLAGPARRLPASLRLRLLFGDAWNQMGWMYLLFATVQIRAFLVPALPGLAMSMTAANPLLLFNPLLALLLSIAALRLLAVGLRKGVRGLRLLNDGRLATGKLERCLPTGRSLDEAPLYELTFRFTLPDGRPYEARALTADPDRLKDEAAEPLVYDPLDPEICVMLDDLPGKPRIDENGDVRVQDGGWTWTLVLLPAGTVLLHVVWTILAR